MAKNRGRSRSRSSESSYYRNEQLVASIGNSPNRKLDVIAASDNTGQMRFFLRSWRLEGGNTRLTSIGISPEDVGQLTNALQHAERTHREMSQSQQGQQQGQQQPRQQTRWAVPQQGQQVA